MKRHTPDRKLLDATLHFLVVEEEAVSPSRITIIGPPFFAPTIIIYTDRLEFHYWHDRLTAYSIDIICVKQP